MSIYTVYVHAYIYIQVSQMWSEQISGGQIVFRSTFSSHLQASHLLPACWIAGGYTANLQSNMSRDKKIITTRFISIAVPLMLRDQSLALKSCSERLKDRSMSTNREWHRDPRNEQSFRRGKSYRDVWLLWFHFMNSLMC